MAVGAKYAPLTRWLKDCGQAEIQLTFSEMDQIVTLPPSAYTNRTLWGNSGQSFSSGWMGAGYLVGRVDMKAQWDAVPPRSGSKGDQRRKRTRRGGAQGARGDRSGTCWPAAGGCGPLWNGILTTVTARGSTAIIFSRSTGLLGKRRFWTRCVSSWHGIWPVGECCAIPSCFKRTHLFHRPAVEFLLEPRWAGLWGLSGEHLACSEGAEQVMTLCGGLTALYERYGGGTPTDTLLTKILLGTLGCVPAYDRYLKEALRRTGAAPGVLGVRSLTQLGQFYLDRRMDFEELHRLCAAGWSGVSSIQTAGYVLFPIWVGA